MRRSAAPSFQSAAKRLKFLSPVNSEHQIKKENELFDFWNSEPDDTIDYIAAETTPKQEQSLSVCEENVSSVKHTADELLELLLKPVHQETETAQSDVQTKSDSAHSIADALLPKQKVLVKQHFLQHSTSTSQALKETEQNYEKHMLGDFSSSHKAELCYNVLWCKRSGKKHKIWEGDGTLIIKGRSAVLKDPDGKIIDRGMGYKIKEVESLEDGSKFFIGGKECEIQYLMSAEECKNLTITDAPENNSPDKSNGPKQSNLCM